MKSKPRRPMNISPEERERRREVGKRLAEGRRRVQQERFERDQRMASARANIEPGDELELQTRDNHYGGQFDSEPLTRNPSMAGVPDIPFDEMDEIERAAVLAGDGRLLSRDVRSGDGPWEVPAHRKRPGWDYVWLAISVYGEQSSNADFVKYSRAGWVAVPARWIPEMCPAGVKLSTLDHEGMRLYMRPMKLTQEALAEMHKIAQEVKNNGIAAAAIGMQGREFAPRINPDGSAAVQISQNYQPLL